MLPQCDYVVVAAPLNAETVGLLSAAEFAAMKPSAVIINVGRGPVINERAMINALSQHKIKGAALDVFDEEPLPVGHALWEFENVVITPHISFYSEESLVELQTKAAEEVVRVLSGQAPRNPVNPEVLQRTAEPSRAIG